MTRIIFFTFSLVICLGYQSIGQDDLMAEFEDFGSNVWLGSYNKFRLADKWFWRAEFHYRRGGYNNIPYIGRMSQIYNRHAINYFVNENLNICLGAVVRLDFTGDPQDD